MDQKLSNSISKGIGCYLFLLGMAMSVLGISLLVSSDRGEIGTLIMGLSLASGTLLLIGAVQYLKKTRVKEQALASYEQQLYRKPEVQGAPEGQYLPVSDHTEVYRPDVVAVWEYTKDEWKWMGRSERKRRFKEGIWVSALVAVLGGLLLSRVRETGYLTGFLISLGVGVLIAVLKILVSDSLFAPGKHNRIMLSTNGLHFNSKFQVIQDDSIQLQHVKPVTADGKKMLEFSIQWMTRNGVTNDQFRVFIPDRYAADIDKVLAYYREKGVSTES